MFENKTMENILAERMAKIPPDLDRSEGSVSWLANAPDAAELAQIYIEIANLYKQMYGDTADRKYLIQIAKDTKGMTPKAATAAVWSISATPTNIDLTGARFSCGTLFLCIIGATETEGEWLAECETAGTVGNSVSGVLLPAEYIDGLQAVTLSVLVIPGADEEETEAFRARWMQSFEARGFGGNKAAYKEMIKALDGIGGVKVFRAQNAYGETEGGHIRCLITAANNMPPSEELVASVQNVIDPTLDGAGDGLALIGHSVHIIGTTGVELHVSTALTYEDGVSFSTVRTSICEAIEGYLASVRAGWENAGSLTVRISHIENAILDVPGVLDISDTTVNGATTNVVIPIEHSFY